MSVTNRGAAWFPQEGAAAGMGQVTPPNMMMMMPQQQQQQLGMPSTMGYMSNSPAGMLTPGAWSVPEGSTPVAGDAHHANPGGEAVVGGAADAMDPAMLALLQQQQQSSCCDCCGKSSSPGCCPTQGQPMDPFCCSTPGAMVPSCIECIYTCMDYTFLLMIILFVLCVVGFALVVGLKDIDNIFAYFNVTDSLDLEMAIRPYVMWRNVTDNVTNSTDPEQNTTTTTTTADPDGTTTTTTTAVPDGTTTTTTTTTTTAAPLGIQTPGSRYAQYLASPATGSVSAESQGVQDYIAYLQDMIVRDVEEVTDESSSDSDYGNCSNITEEMFPENCTTRHLLGSFGTICMEGNFNANVMAVQLSHWNNAKATLWFLAMVYTAIAIIYAVLIHRQRFPAVPFVPPQINPQQMQSMTQQQREQMMFMLMQQQQQQAACCGSRGVEVYDTPLYEFIRIAWLFVGFTVFCWTCNLFISFWAFSGFYVNNSTEFLHDFWKAYAQKFTGTVVMVTIYLAWPVCNFFLELVIWIIGFLPWLAIRSCCRPGINMFRPELPNSELPGWIRTDMFFTDFNDVKRLGFSRQAWIMLTGKSTPYCDSCTDLTVDRDPTMKALMDQLPTMQFANFMQQQQQQQMMMMQQQQQQQQMMMMQQQQQQQLQASGVVSPNAPVVPAPDAAQAAPAASSEAPTKRRRRSSKSRERSHSRSHHRSTHADPQAQGDASGSGAAAGGSAANNAALMLDATSAAMPAIPEQEGASKSRHHRSSRSRAAAGEGESASRSHRHRSTSKQADEGESAGGAAAGGESRSHRHRSGSKSRTNADEGGSRSRAHRSRSRERSKERKKKSGAQADLDALAEL